MSAWFRSRKYKSGTGWCFFRWTDIAPVVLNLEARACNDGVVTRIKHILGSHRGKSPVHLQIRGARSTMVVRLGDEFRVDPRNGLYAEIKAELGPDALLT